MIEKTDIFTRCGYVALVGPPNAGKSTLMNQLLGQKLAIVSPKVQTTRTRLMGVLTEGDNQFVFIDTPGIFTPENKSKKLERAMVHAAWEGAGGADMLLLLIDASEKNALNRHADLIEALQARKERGGPPLYIALNKVDLVVPERLLPLAAALQSALDPVELFMISAATGAGIEILKKKLAAVLPTGPFLYDPEEVTDISLRLLAAEFTREQLFLQLKQEVPYDAMVETEVWETHDNGSVRITQSIVVAREGQKGIVIGKGGARLKEIGTAARKQIAELVGAQVHLMLNVKVREGWQDDREFYETWGLKK